MPNHTSCVLKVVGTRKALKAFKEKAVHVRTLTAGEKIKMIFSLESFLPMPEELLKVNHPIKIVSQKEYDAAWDKNAKAIAKNPDTFFLDKPITAAMQKEYIAKFGADNWYDWANKNWGTKWGIYEVSEKWEQGPFKNDSLPTPVGETGGMEVATVCDWQITCYFQSAWAPPSTGIANISKLFPDLTFFCGYADEGGGFLGYSIFNNGVEQENMLPHQPWDGEHQIEFRRMCGQIIYEDELEEEPANA